MGGENASSSVIDVILPPSGDRASLFPDRITFPSVRMILAVFPKRKDDPLLLTHL